MKYKLGECIEEIVDKTTENNQYEVLSVTKDGIYSQEEFFKKQIASEDNTGYKIIRKNNLVFSTMNLWMGSLDVLSNYEIGIVSPAYKIFKFDESKMIPSFGKYFMKSHFMLEQYKNCSEQGASIVRRNLDLKQLLDTEIIIPTVEEQCKIVKVLENIDEIINKYTNLIKNKEQFIKSQFVEMFENKNYEKILIKKAIEKGFIDKPLDGNHGNKHPKTSDYVKQGIPFLLSNNIKNGTVDCVNCNFITEKQALSLDKGFAKNDDVLITHKGTIGETAILHTNYEFVMLTPQITYYRVNKKYLIPEYLKEYFNSSKFQLIMKKIASSGSTRSYIGITEQQNLELMIPPIEVQRKFNQIVQLIDKQKFELEKQKRNYIDLKKGLMQQLLTGKLKVS